MKQQLTSEHIAWYLPHGLKGFCKDSKSADKLLGIYGTGGHSLTMCYRINNHNTVDYGCNIDDFKPILLPMSDLTKPFVKDGVETTHLQELAKIALPFCPNKLKEDSVLVTTANGNVFFSVYKNDFYINDRIVNLPVKSQIPLFQYLAKHKFDFNGLIEPGLAIDVNTLENNVYN